MNEDVDELSFSVSLLLMLLFLLSSGKRVQLCLVYLCPKLIAHLAFLFSEVLKEDYEVVTACLIGRH